MSRWSGNKRGGRTLLQVGAAALLLAAGAFSQQHEGAASAAAAFQRGRQAYLRHDNAAAIRAFREAERADPRSAEIHNALGEALLAAQQAGPAVAELRLAVKRETAQPLFRFNLAVAQSRAGDLGGAETSYRQLLAAHDTAPVRLNLGQLLEFEHRPAEALEQYRRAVALAPRLAAAHALLGHALVHHGELQAGLASLRQALKLEPDNPDTLADAGQALLMAGQPDQAELLLQRAVRLNSRHGQANYALGVLAAEHEQWAQALPRLLIADEALPRNPRVHDWLGQAFEKLGDVDSAVAQYRQALALDATSGDVRNHLGLALLEQGQADASLAEFRQLVTEMPDNLQAHNNLGVAYVQKADFDHAIEQYQWVLAHQPDDAEAHYNLGFCYKGKDQLTDAERELRRALALDPKLADAYYTLGVVEWQQGQLAGAAADLRQAIALRPDHAAAYYTLGTVLKENGDRAGATTALRRAIALDPGLGGAHYMLAGLLRAAGDREGARRELAASAAIEKSKESHLAAVFKVNLGAQELAQGKLEEAVNELQAAISDDPQFARAHLHLAQAFDRLGRRQEAQQQWHEAEALDPRLTALHQANPSLTTSAVSDANAAR